MRTYITLSFLLLFINICHSQNPTFKWAKNYASNNRTEALGLAIDNGGNVYTTGALKGTVDFDPNAGIANLSSNGSGEDVYISKLDSSGNYIWAISFGSFNCYDRGHSIKIASNGDVIVVGSFVNTPDFDPGPGVFNLTSYAGAMFLARYTSAGNFVWAKKFDATNYGNYYFEKIALDQNDNIYITAHFNNPFDADPNAGVLTVSPLVAYDDDAFVGKYDGNGNLIWAKQLGHSTISSYNMMYTHSLVLDQDGNVYTVGIFGGTVDFDPGAGTYNLTHTNGMSASDIYVSKLDANGNFVFAKQIKGSSIQHGVTIDVDNDKNIILAGGFEGLTDFDPGPGVFNLTTTGFSNGDNFIEKLDSNGNFVWVKQFGNSTNYDLLNSIHVDNDNSILCTGAFKATVDFNPGSAIRNLTALHQQDAFILKLNASGNFEWVQQLMSDSVTFGRAIEKDNFNNIYSIGSFNAITDFDTDSTSVFSIIPMSPFQEPYIHKMQEQCTLDMGITISGLTLTSNQSNAIYQWLECEPQGMMAIAGATNQSYTSSGSGQYALVVINGNCSDTTECISVNGPLGIHGLSSGSSLIIYPNPTADYFVMDAPIYGYASLFDVLGKRVLTVELIKGRNEVAIKNLSDGLYYLKYGGDSSHTYKLVVRKK
jgi:Secretion system C-terminal sorting domain/Beta-propeller repeat